MHAKITCEAGNYDGLKFELMWPSHGKNEEKKRSKRSRKETKKKNKKEEEGGGRRKEEKDRTRWGCLHLITGLCPCYRLAYSTADRPVPNNVLCNALTMLQATFSMSRSSNVHGGMVVTLYYDQHSDICRLTLIYILFFFLTLLLSSFWTSRGHRCRPFAPPVLAFNSYRA